MKRLLVLIASLLVGAIFVAPGAHAESIACAAEVPKPAKGHWYYSGRARARHSSLD